MYLSRKWLRIHFVLKCYFCAYHNILFFRDLSFKKGDVITLRKQVDENWYHGELGNKHGFFPATYVQVSLSHMFGKNGW